MAMMDDTPTNRAMGLGLRPPGAGFGGDPATRMGLGSMQPTRADTAVQGEPVARTPGLQGMNSTFQQMGLPPIPAPQAAVPARPPATVYFNPATNEMFAGDRAFKADDTVAAMEAAQMPGNTTRPQGQGWTALPEGSFQQYIASFSERRSTGELLGRGVKNIAYGLGTLPGTAATLAGFEETGAALRAPVEAMLGESESEQLRSALIAQNSSLWEQALDAGIESIPMLVGSIAGGMGGAAMASRAGLAATGVARAGTAGAAAFNFPTHLAGMYDAAVRNQADLADPQTKIEILGGALASAYLDTFGIEGRLLSPVAKGAVQGAARNAVLSRLQSGVRTGLVEGLTEVGQTGLETLMFDPVVRDNLNPQDWKILAPHIAKQYGDAYMVSFLAGMGLGAITGTVLPQGAAARGEKTPLDTNKPVDLNVKATEQAAPEPEPVVAPMAEPVPQGLGPVVPALSPEEARLAADWQADTALGPAVPALGESEQALADQWRSTLGPMQLTPELRVPPQARPAAATPMGSLLLTPEMRVPPQAAPSRPGQVLLTQRQRVGETPTVSMMAPVVEARPGAMLLRPEQRALPTTPTPAPAAPTAPVTPVAPVAVAPEEAVAARRVLDRMVFIPADYEPSQSELTAKARLDRAYAAFDQKYAIRQDQVGPPHRRTPAAEWTGGDYFEAQREGTPEFKEIEAASIAYNKAAASRTDALNNLRYELSQALPERAADIAADPLAFALAAQAETTIPMVDPKFSPESRPSKGGALTKAQRAAAKKAQTVAIVMDRVAALSPAQQLALMERLDVVDMDGVRAAAEADPVRVAKIVDAVTMPTPPTGPKGAGLQETGRKPKDTTPRTGPKGDNLTRGRNKSALDEEAAAKAKAKAKADEEAAAAKAKADEEAAAAAKAKADEEAQTPTQVTAVPDAKGDLATRVPRRSAGSKALGLDYDYYIVKLSDDRVFETRVLDGKWVFRADTNLPVEAADGVKLTTETMPEAVARMASEGKLDGLRAESMLTPKGGKPAEPDISLEQRAAYEGVKADIEDLGAALGSPSAPMKGDRLYAALDLMATRDDPSTPNALKEMAIAILEEGTTAKTLAEAELAYAKQTSTRKGKAKAEKQVEMPKAVSDLIDLIEKFNMRPATASSAIPAEFAALARTVAENHPDAVYNNRPLTSYFSGGKPNLKEVFGRRQIVPADGTGRNALADFNMLVGAVDLNGKPVVPLAPGRVDLLVRNFTAKLKIAPKLTVVRNQADLQAKNPRLYLRAKNARTDGTFDTAEAMGYSFGDGEIILFTDRIGTEQQLNFVLAHETLGHFGMRAIMPADKFNAVMDKVYNSDPLLRTSVDMAVATRGMTRAEATEEYLADHAAVIEMSYLRWVAAALKDALNVLGFRFSDDMTRHLIRMSRRYVRNGKRDNLFSASSIFADVQTIESGGDQLGTGRFKQGFKTDNLRTDLLNYDVFGGVPRTVEDVTAGLKEGGERLSTTMETAVNKFFSLTAFRARDNAGLAELVRVLSRATEIAAEVRNRADEIMRRSLNTELRIMGIRIMGDITKKQQDASSFLNYTQQDNIRGKVDEKVDKVVKALRDNKKLTRMFTISGDQVVPNIDAIKAYRDAGRLSLSQAKAMLAKDKRYAGLAAELTETHPTWLAYENTRKAFEVSELQFVETQYKALLEDRKNAQMSMFDMLPPPPVGEEKVLLPGDYAMFNTWAAKHFEILAEGATTVEDNIVATVSGTRAADEFSKTVNTAIIAKGFDNKTEEAIRKYFKGKQADDFIAQVVAFRKRVVRNADNEFLLQAKIREFGAAELSYTSAEMSARKLLVQGYTPIVRKQQRYQITVAAYDAETGERVELDGEYKGMAVYRTVGTMEEGTSLASRMQDIFSDTSKTEFEDTTVKEVDGKLTRTYKVSGRTAKESDAKTRQVVLRAEVSAAVSGMTTPLNLNLNEFLRGLRQYGLNIHPEKLEQIVTDMTSQDARARKRLEQTGNPGYQVEGGVNALQAMSQHIDGRASLIAKIQLRPEIDRLLNLKLESSRKLWFGDKKRLKDLKDTYERLSKDPNANEDAVFLAKAEYDDYAYKMRNTITTKNGIDINLGNKFLTEAHSLMAFVNGNRDLNESDWGAGPVASWLRRWISSSQLGGTLSQPIMNNIGPFTNFVPWLASYNPKNGFGGNAGMSKAYVAYLRAMSDVGGGGGVSFSKRALEMHTADYWDQVATGMVEHDGVSRFEAKFIANETRRGILTPAQANSLMGASRNYTTNPAIRQALDKWMFFYLSSEQATRRAAALAAFRVEMNRQLSATGMTPEQLSDPKFADTPAVKAMYARASKFATDGVTLTLGDYNALNRPAAWRSGLQSFLYMYRVWPTTSIQTLSRLDNKGKALFLLPLLILSGVAGLPFAEDLEDVLDTIAQRTGMSIGSVRLEAARLIDEIFPGWSPYILNGGMTALLGVDTSGRFGMGDFVPGSAAFLPGQELSDTIKDVIGPAWGFIEGTFKGGAELAAAPFSETATVVNAMREGPVTLFRSLGDAYIYQSTGAVIDKRGYVIQPDGNTRMLMSRIFGFTPGSVAADYELIRLAKRETNYQKQVVARIRRELLIAELSGDSVTAASLRRTVKEWNEANKGTLLEIRNFEKNYQALKKKATMSARERFLQSAGKANQDAIEFIGELVMYD